MSDDGKTDSKSGEGTPLINGGHYKRTLTLWHVVAIAYFSVAGGPEGTETIVRNGGAALAVLGILVIGLIWSIPTALMTAELATMLPENGGYTLWVPTPSLTLAKPSIHPP